MQQFANNLRYKSTKYRKFNTLLKLAIIYIYIYISRVINVIIILVVICDVLVLFHDTY